jgi:hypothetical protein
VLTLDTDSLALPAMQTHAAETMGLIVHRRKAADAN